MTRPPAPLWLPRHLQGALWDHALRVLPEEAVGVLGAESGTGGVHLRALYPLHNVAPDPRRQYLAEPAGLLRALKAMQAAGLTLGAIYHSHPHGPAVPSAADVRLAGYAVPYVIADVPGRTLRAYLLPGGEEVELRRPDD